MQQNTEDKQSEKSDSKNLSLAQASEQHSNPSVLIDDGMPPYISEVGRIRIMREFYKKETQKYMNEDLSNSLENEKTTKLETVNKLKMLVDFNKSLLSHMDTQRAASGDLIKEFVQMSKTLFKSNIENQNESVIMADAEKSINKLLTDINN